jgi:excisionase family DNA binding protein
MMMNVDDDKTCSRLIDRSRRNNHAAASTLPPVFNTSEACHYLRISRPTFLKLIASGKIRAQKLGKGWKVLDSELERFLLAGEASQQ